MVDGGKGKAFSPNTSTDDFFSDGVIWTTVEPSLITSSTRDRIFGFWTSSQQQQHSIQTNLQ